MNSFNEPSLGVSLSGGGFRAAAFGLGALIYLKKAGLNKNVSSIASVSGGSFTNAFVGFHSAFKEGDPSQFSKEIRPLAEYLAYGGVAFEAVPAVLKKTASGGLLMSSLGLLLGVLYCFHVIPIAVYEDYPRLSLIAPVISVIILIAGGACLGIGIPLWFFRILNAYYILTLHRDLFRPPTEQKDTKPISFTLLDLLKSPPQLPATAVLLKNLEGDVDHILCATDLSSGSHFLMAPKFNKALGRTRATS